MKPEDTLRPEIPWMDPAFLKNWRQLPEEELDRYSGQYVAWSWDGTRILAGAPSDEELYRKLKDEGIDPQRVVFDYIPDPEVGLF